MQLPEETHLPARISVHLCPSSSEISYCPKPELSATSSSYRPAARYTATGGSVRPREACVATAGKLVTRAAKARSSPATLRAPGRGSWWLTGRLSASHAVKGSLERRPRWSTIVPPACWQAPESASPHTEVLAATVARTMARTGSGTTRFSHAPRLMLIMPRSVEGIQRETSTKTSAA